MMEAAVNYLNMIETRRRNAETERNNRRVENETQRANQAREHENRRSNMAKEAIDRLSAEASANLHNEQAETERTANRSLKYAQANSANASAINQRAQARTESQKFKTEKQKYKTEQQKTKSAKAQATIDAANAKHADYRAWVGSIGQTAEVAEGVSKEVRGWVSKGISDIGTKSVTETTSVSRDRRGQPTTTTTKSTTTTGKATKERNY